MNNTPITPFRLKDETREQLKRVADAWGTTMTDAVRRTTKAMDDAVAAMKAAGAKESDRYPFDAYIAACEGFRSAMGYEPGDILSSEFMNAIDVAVMSALPAIREEQYDDTLRGIIVRLEGLQVDPDAIAHLRKLLPAD